VRFSELVRRRRRRRGDEPIPGPAAAPTEVDPDAAPPEGALAAISPLPRWDVPLLDRPETQTRLAREGFAVVEDLLDDAGLRELRDVADEFLSLVGEPLGELFVSVGRVEDPTVRTEMISKAGDVVSPAIAEHFVEGARVFGSGFQVKPASPESALNPHQDSSLVEESTWPGVYVWIPLVDTDRHNGGLAVLPRSHRFWNPHRTLSVPWQFEGLQDVMWELVEHLEVGAGSAVFFDSALVHASPPNHSGTTRVAVNNFVRPAPAPMMHYLIDEATTPGMVDVYEIDETFFLRDDIMARPVRHRHRGEEPHVRFDCDAAGFVAAYEDLLAN